MLASDICAPLDLRGGQFGTDKTGSRVEICEVNVRALQASRVEACNLIASLRICCL